MNGIEPGKPTFGQGDQLEPQISHFCIHFLKVNEMAPFRSAEFNFYRMDIRIAGTFRLIGFHGDVFTCEFPLGPDLELLLVRYWADQKKKRYHMLQILYIGGFTPEIKFLNSYVLKTLERKGQSGYGEILK